MRAAKASGSPRAVSLIMFAMIRSTAEISPFDIPPSCARYRINTGGQIVGGYGQPTVERGFLDSGGIFSSIDVPFAGARATQARGINTAGQIVGGYVDATGSHGFLDDGGIFSAIDVPFAGVLSTDPFGINDLGQIVGLYSDATGDHGFWQARPPSASRRRGPSSAPPWARWRLGRTHGAG